MIIKIREWFFQLSRKHPVYVGLVIFLISLAYQIIYEVITDLDSFYERFWIKMGIFTTISFVGLILTIVLSYRKNK